MTTEIATAQERAIVQQQPSEATQSWELMQRRAKAFSCSTIVPEAYRGPEKLANVVIALDIADRLHTNPLQVMQNLHIIQGRPSWSSSFLIATVNTCGRFTPLRFETRGSEDPFDRAYQVRAIATDRESGVLCAGPWISYRMAEAEGWLKKSGSKWLTMPELMFMYRAAAFWSRVYAPEVSMGFLTREEAEDIHAPQVQRVTDVSTVSELQRRLEQSAAIPQQAPNTIDAFAEEAGSAPEPTASEE